MRNGENLVRDRVGFILKDYRFANARHRDETMDGRLTLILDDFALHPVLHLAKHMGVRWASPTAIKGGQNSAPRWTTYPRELLSPSIKLLMLDQRPQKTRQP